MENIKARAYHFLVEYDINELPVDLICLNKKGTDFKIITYSVGEEIIILCKAVDYAREHMGFTLQVEGENIILFDDNLSYSERNLVIAHEIGHIVLGHTISNQILGKSSDGNQYNNQEIEADIFALALIAPIPILAKMGASTPKEISHITGLSIDQARNVALDILKENNSKDNFYNQKLLLTFDKFLKKPYNRKPRKTKLNIILLILLCLGLGIAVYFTKFKDSTTDVYTTSFGNKYHLENCQYIQDKEAVKISLSDAKRSNYIPCKICFDN